MTRYVSTSGSATQPLPPAVLIHYNLAGAATKKSHAAEYRAYVIGQYLRQSGQIRGRDGNPVGPTHSIPVDSLVAALADTALCGQAKTIRETIKRGMDLFWDPVSGERVQFVGPDNLARRLGLEHAGERYKRYQIEDLKSGDIAEFRGLLDDARLYDRPTRAGRESVAKRTETTPQTQRRRERLKQAPYFIGEQEYIDFTFLAYPASDDRQEEGAPKPNLEEIARHFNENGRPGFFVHTDESGKQHLLRPSAKIYQSSRPSYPRYDRAGAERPRASASALKDRAKIAQDGNKRVVIPKGDLSVEDFIGLW